MTAAITWADITATPDRVRYLAEIPTRADAERLLSEADAPGAPVHRGWRAALVDLVAAWDWGMPVVPHRRIKNADGTPLVYTDGRPYPHTLRLPRTGPARWVIGSRAIADDASALTRAGYRAAETGKLAPVKAISRRGVHAAYQN